MINDKYAPGMLHLARCLIERKHSLGSEQAFGITFLKSLCFCRALLHAGKLQSVQ